MITAILFVVLMLLIATRLASYMTYGSLIKDEEWVPILEKQSQNGSKLNPFDSDMIYIGNTPCIVHLPFDIFGKYYIFGMGIVPRWSKSHKLIKAEFEKLKKEQFNKYK